MRNHSHVVLMSVQVVLIAAGVLASAQAAPRTPQEAYERGMNLITGTGVNRNDVEAVENFRRTAEGGYAPGHTVMGFLYETGTVVPNDLRVAASWYGKAAAQDDHLAQWVLGRMYLAGQGLVTDRNAAMKWLRPSAQAGNPFAALLLGEAEEVLGAPNAVPWYRKAAEQGLPEAQVRLGKLLAGGSVGAPDKYDAYVWLLVAFQNGRTDVSDDLKRLEPDLGAVKLEHAKTYARALRNETRRSVVSNGCTGWPGELDPQPTTPPIQNQPMCR